MSYPTGLTGNTKKAYDRISARAKTSSKAESLQFVINTGLCDATACDAMADLSDEALDQLIEDVGGGAPHDIARYLRTAFAWVPMKVLGDPMSGEELENGSESDYPSPYPKDILDRWTHWLAGTATGGEQDAIERARFDRAALRMLQQEQIAYALRCLSTWARQQDRCIR